jgi:hypothetical protein
MQKRTQADHVTEELGVQEEFDTEEIHSPGIGKLHEKSIQDMAEILALAIKSRPIVTAVHVTRKTDGQTKKERISFPGIKELHLKPSMEQGEALALIWKETEKKSGNKTVGLHYIPGEYVEVVTSDGKAGETIVELTTARLNR